MMFKYVDEPSVCTADWSVSICIRQKRQHSRVILINGKKCWTFVVNYSTEVWRNRNEDT